MLISMVLGGGGGVCERGERWVRREKGGARVPVYLAVFKERDRGEAVIGEEAGRYPKRGVDALDVIGCWYCVCR